MYYEDWSHKIADIISSFCEQIKPLSEKIDVWEYHIKCELIKASEKLKPVRAFYILSDYQFTYWKPLSSDDIDILVSTDDVNGYLASKIEDNSFIDYDEIFNEILSSDFISTVDKVLLQQSIEAMKKELFDLALVGIMVVIDDVLTNITNDATTSIGKRLRIIEKKLEDLLDEEWKEISDRDITVIGMYITWTESLNAFNEHSNFNKPESEPQKLNRHWTLHGRKTGFANKLDCCKIINLLYGLIYFGEETK